MSDNTPAPLLPTKGRFFGLRVAASVIVCVIWSAYMLALVTLGSCEAFGGRCDGTKPPILEDDVVGGAFIGTTLAAWMLWWLRRPSLRQAVSGIAVAAGAAIFVALIARDMAHS